LFLEMIFIGQTGSRKGKPKQKIRYIESVANASHDNNLLCTELQCNAMKCSAMQCGIIVHQKRLRSTTKKAYGGTHAWVFEFLPPLLPSSLIRYVLQRNMFVSSM